MTPSKSGTKLDKRNVATKFRALMQECRIEGVHPHTLRHTANKYVSHNDPAYLLQEMQKIKY